jgi:hypothetical protein
MEARAKRTPNPKYTQHGNLPHSSAIRSYSYDDKNQILLLYFIKGGTGRFRDVPQHIVNGLIKASSAGSYFHTYIKGVYQQY